MRGNKKKYRKVGLLFLFLLFLGFACIYVGYKLAFSPAVTVWSNDAFYVHTGWTEKEVLDELVQKRFVSRPQVLSFIFDQKNYSGTQVVPGKYILRQGMSLTELTNHLRAGNGEEQVKLTFSNVRTLSELASKVARQTEADSLQLISVFCNPTIQRDLGFNANTFIGMFLPDTYFVEWDTKPIDFLTRMRGEYEKFWTEERLQRASVLGLSENEVSTLASIVQAEQQMFPDERPVIARLYLNRLRIGMRLQSDPTVIYAIGDFQINRVLNKHLSADSPFNTYIYAGLPPGPINVPSKKSIDAVLYPDSNNYLYMCAKADFSGKHAFATNLDEHNRNAAAFRRALDKMKILQ